MLVTIFVCTILVMFSSELLTTMEHSKLTQHAEICMVHIQGENVFESHKELVRIHYQSALSLSTVHQWFCKFAVGM